jgi:glucan phosphoethanolaminetransferase (alkaline phosphatase superfamily)
MVDIGSVLLKLTPNALWRLENNDYSTVVWMSPEIEQPTVEQVNAEMARQEAEKLANQYKSLRANEYPSMQDQLDMQFWDAQNGTTTWQDAINAVKNKYPKP